MRNKGQKHSIYLYDGKLFPELFGIIYMKWYRVDFILTPPLHWIDNHASFAYI